ncbi:hypothetical protein TWF696_007032 [Orbilia brochopaga]|uniref:UBC core domain-containing protein n=1 Tax=Orbilia brochopaga TaxID=3140254 RepID=A0AAV9UU91_9PEZI
MPRKAFVADLQQVQAHSPHPAVNNIKKGEDDGSFTFNVTLTTTSRPVEITALIPELGDYPSDHECVLFITSEGASQAISDAIESLNVRATKVSNIINATATAICTKRGTKRPRSADAEFDSDAMDVDLDSVDEPDDDGEEQFGNDDDDGSIGGWSSVISDNELVIGDSQVAGSADPMESEYIREFCRDLRAVKNAGFKVGVLGSLPGGSGYVAVSIRIAKLGISDEAMTAWRLNPDKYLILLMHYPQGYKPLSAMAKDAYTAKKWLQFYVGTSSSYKPSLQEAIIAFTKVKKFKEDQDGNIHIFKGEGGKLDVHGLSGSQSSTSAPPTFEGTFISRPVSELLNERLLALAMYRISYGFGWDGAELFYEDFQGRERTDEVEDRYYQEDHGVANLPPIVQSDVLKASKSNTDIAFPLVAIQYLLRHFVRCTEFCLVCHNKINATFEALKPYVCDKPLCLYQYMALGFGPSMEYEILDQPSVIDLLISFCWASAVYHKLSDFPTGLNLTVPMPASFPYNATYDKSTQELTVPQMEGEYTKLNTGDWIVMMEVGGPETVHCRVVDADYLPFVRLAVLSTSPDSRFVVHKDPKMFPDNIKIPVMYGVYNAKFDELTDTEKRNSIVQMLDTLPSVNDMRDWLVANTKVGEEISLKSWKNRISPSALLLLRWIVASNRSCIVQIDQTPEDPNGTPQTKTPPDGTSTAAETKDQKKSIMGEERVHGMEGYLQFRFAMGAPDKEQRFVNEVRNAVQTSGLTYPTLFAFHGSPIQNWHSIIREGLHFRETSHGRAYGHGVYHSLDAHVSLGYTRSYFGTTYPSNSSGGKWWPKSHLCINNALCLNEIVNLPTSFVSRSPHLVVDKLDWIQTRYLFVHTERPPSNTGSESEQAALVPARALPQDPLLTPKGIGHKSLVIPETASTVRTRSGNNTNISQHLCQPSAPKKSKLSSKIGRFVKAATGSFTDPIRIDDDGYVSAATDTEDLDILLIDDKGKATGKAAAKDGNKKTNKKKDANAFVPGQLDISSIQLLAEPPYASPMATKRIQQELRTLLKIQETHDLEDLGWYINHQFIENVYQWIIELHSFDSNLPLAEDMKNSKVSSIVMEVRFGKDFPMTPPFFRVIRPRFLPFQRRGGGHVTAGGALCMELLTNSGWSAVSSLESVFLQIRLAMSSLEPYPARLDGGADSSYTPHEAKDAFIRACRTHGWQVPPDFSSII